MNREGREKRNKNGRMSGGLEAIHKRTHVTLFGLQLPVAGCRASCSPLRLSLEDPERQAAPIIFHPARTLKQVIRAPVIHDEPHLVTYHLLHSLLHCPTVKSEVLREDQRTNFASSDQWRRSVRLLSCWTMWHLANGLIMMPASNGAMLVGDFHQGQ